jgi:hypothetical protein
MATPARASLVLFVAVLLPSISRAQAPVEYRLSFEEAEHRLMDVQVSFRDVPPGPLELRMSRSSPGRYALHEFVKNVFDVRITNEAGMPLPAERPSPHQWSVTGHTGAVRVSYRVFGDRVDGTYLGIDSTHAHINMPAALMWARGFEMRPATLRFEAPAGFNWRVGTQLFPGETPLTFTAPNLQYLMDSPTEASTFSLTTNAPPRICVSILAYAACRVESAGSSSAIGFGNTVIVVASGLPTMVKVMGWLVSVLSSKPTAFTLTLGLVFKNRTLSPTL